MASVKPTPKRYDRGWRVNFKYPRGVRHQLRFPDRTYPDAWQAAQNYIDNVLGGRAADAVPMEKIVRLYLSWAERTGKKTPATIRTDQNRLNAFIGWAKRSKIVSPRDITVTHIRDFQDWFFDNFPLYKNARRRYAGELPVDEFNRRRLATWDKYRLALSAFLGWCADREYANHNVIAGAKEFRVKLQQKIDFRIFSAEELERLFSYFDERGDLAVSTFFRILAYAGLRTGEARSLRWTAVDLAEGVIQVRGQTKSKKVRSVPINDNLRPWLCELRGRARGISDYVFADEEGTGKKYQHCNWYLLLQNALKRLNLPHARLHDFRHTFGAHLAMAGVPILEITELMGHADPRTTWIYVHFAPKHLKPAISKLPY